MKCLLNAFFNRCRRRRRNCFHPVIRGNLKTPTSTQSTLIRRIVHRKLNFSKSHFNWKLRPFPRSLLPLFQSESKCKTILMKMTLICMKIGNCMQFHFHMKGFALGLVLKQRHKELKNRLLFFILPRTRYNT